MGSHPSPWTHRDSTAPGGVAGRRPRSRGRTSIRSPHTPVAGQPMPASAPGEGGSVGRGVIVRRAVAVQVVADGVQLLQDGDVYEAIIVPIVVHRRGVGRDPGRRQKQRDGDTVNPGYPYRSPCSRAAGVPTGHRPAYRPDAALRPRRSRSRTPHPNPDCRRDRN